MKNETTKQPDDSNNDKPERLSTLQTNKTFHSLLRKSPNESENVSEKTYLFPRGECPPPKNLPESKSHIVNFQVEENSKYIAARKVRYIKDNVVLNDSDKDYQPINRFQKKRFAKVETDTSNQYSNETKNHLQSNPNLSRRVRENYTKNPVSIMNQNQIQDYNTEQQSKMINHTRAVTDYLSSKGVQKSFLAPTNNTVSSNGNNTRDINNNTSTKINTVPVLMLKKAIDQKKQEPNFAKRGFKSYLVGSKQLSFV